MPLVKPLQVLHTFALVPASFPQFGQDAISAPNFDYLLRPKYFFQVFRQSQIRLSPASEICASTVEGDGAWQDDHLRRQGPGGLRRVQGRAGQALWQTGEVSEEVKLNL